MTIHNGEEFFDDEKTHAAYQARRTSGVSANDLLEQPALDAMLGDVRGLDVFDLGCGDGRYGLSLLERGCRSYRGMDASTRMVTGASETLGERGRVSVGRAEELVLAETSVDLVVSRMTLHWVEDLAPVFTAIRTALRSRGRFAFSVEHPILTCCDVARRAGSGRTSWVVDDYFVEGPRITEWFNARVRKYHRSVETYFQALLGAGFSVDELREATPTKDRFPDAKDFKRHQKVPLMLLMVATAKES